MIEIEPFLAETWEQGNSILLTIPSHIKKLYNIDKKETYQVYLRKKSEEELRREKTLEILERRYSQKGSARILDGKKVIAEIPTIFFVLRQGVLTIADGENISEALKKVPFNRFHGQIFEGRLILSELSKFFDGKLAYDGRYLIGGCVLEINDGQKVIKIGKVEFATPISKDKVDLSEIEVKGELIK